MSQVSICRLIWSLATDLIPPFTILVASTVMLDENLVAFVQSFLSSTPWFHSLLGAIRIPPSQVKSSRVGCPSGADIAISVSLNIFLIVFFFNELKASSVRSLYPGPHGPQCKGLAKPPFHNPFFTVPPSIILATPSSISSSTRSLHLPSIGARPHCAPQEPLGECDLLYV